jgi:hypothetical protein
VFCLQICSQLVSYAFLVRISGDRRDPRCVGGQPGGMRSIWFRSTSDASGAKCSRDIWRLSFHYQSHLSTTRAVIEAGPESRTTRGTYYVALELELSLYEPRALSIQPRSISGEELQSRRQRKKLVRTRSWPCLRIDHGESSSTLVELPTSYFLGSLKTFHRCSSNISCLLFGNQPIHRILFLHLTFMT